MFFNSMLGGFGSGISELSWAAWNGSADGTIATIESGFIQTQPSVCRLDNLNFVVAYVKYGGTGVGVVVGSVSGNSFTCGLFQYLGSAYGTIFNISPIITLDSTRCAVMYTDGSNNLKAVIITVNTTTKTATAGTEITLLASSGGSSTTGTARWNLCLQDTDKILFAYTKPDNKGYACVATVSGTTINTPGTEFNFETGSIASVSCLPVSTINASSSMVSYVVGTDMKARVLSISGTTITAPTAAITVNTSALNVMGNGSRATMVVVSSSLALCYYRVALGYLKSVPLTISGTTLTAQTEGTISAVDSEKGWITDIVPTTSNEVMFGFNINDSAGNTYDSKGVIGAVSTTVTPYTAITVWATSTVNLRMAMVKIDNNTIMHIESTTDIKGKVLKRI